MFNGIIKNTGTVKEIKISKKDCKIVIFSKLKFSKNEIGESVCCSGACLTLSKIYNNKLFFYVSKETLKRTNFRYLKKNSIINIEKSLKFGDKISGHFVQGHVDTTAKIAFIKHVGKSWLIRFNINTKFTKLLITKGSIAINGVSLTISKVLLKSFEISLIPHTLKLTNLFFLKKNDIVNVEFDILLKYINTISK